MEPSTDLVLDDLGAELGVLRVYRQVFAVLAREHGAMTDDALSLDVDEAILEAFAQAGAEGLTAEQVVLACRRHPAATVTRRFEVLRGYGAISRVVDRTRERFHRAAFAPYVMLLFLRRLASHGGQGELHQLLTLEGLSVRSPKATTDDGRGSVDRLTKVFRLMANQLASLAVASPVEELREHAELLWGNRGLIGQAEEVHAQVLARWPELDRECAALRRALAAYGDASDAAAARLIERAGSTRALGLLPVETWRSFARTADAQRLAGVLDGLVFDAPAPWFAPQDLVTAVDSARMAGPTRLPPPRPSGGEPAPDAIPAPDPDTELAETVTRLLGDADRAELVGLLDREDAWPDARRLLAVLTAAHHSPTVDAQLHWQDELRVDPSAPVPWASHGTLVRTPAGGGSAGVRPGPEPGHGTGPGPGSRR
ncbi:MAG TPA: hypothetical protein VFP72_17535 [Kineosporiaceae bacterium]|nr:hypothetical protein [Kineosporiaceae bacterium]